MHWWHLQTTLISDGIRRYLGTVNNTTNSWINLGAKQCFLVAINGRRPPWKQKPPDTTRHDTLVDKINVICKLISNYLRIFFLDAARCQKFMSLGSLAWRGLANSSPIEFFETIVSRQLSTLHVPVS